MIADFMTGYMGKTALRGSSVGEEYELPVNDNGDPTDFLGTDVEGQSWSTDSAGKVVPTVDYDSVTAWEQRQMDLFNSPFHPDAAKRISEQEDAVSLQKEIDEWGRTGQVPPGGALSADADAAASDADARDLLQRYALRDARAEKLIAPVSGPWNRPTVGPVRTTSRPTAAELEANKLRKAKVNQDIAQTNADASTSDADSEDGESWWDTHAGGVTQSGVKGFALGAGVSALLNFMRGKPVSVRRMILMGIFAGAGNALYKHLGGWDGITGSDDPPQHIKPGMPEPRVSPR